MRQQALLVEQAVNDALPQTQCTRCGYPDCAAYAHAIALESAPINRCPPGGAEGVHRLSALTGQSVAALDTACGLETPRTLAVIDEAWCIGCTLCLEACPTDAIVGSNKLMHTVIPEHCTGCELCLPVCPVDCIAMENASGSSTGWSAWSPSQARHAQARYANRQQRRAASNPAPSVLAQTDPTIANSSKSAVIAAVLARAKAKRKA